MATGAQTTQDDVTMKDAYHDDDDDDDQEGMDGEAEGDEEEDAVLVCNRQSRTTLALLQTFHAQTRFWLLHLAALLPPPATANDDNSRGVRVVVIDRCRCACGGGGGGGAAGAARCDQAGAWPAEQPRRTLCRVARGGVCWWRCWCVRVRVRAARMAGSPQTRACCLRQHAIVIIEGNVLITYTNLSLLLLLLYLFCVLDVMTDVRLLLFLRLVCAE